MFQETIFPYNENSTKKYLQPLAMAMPTTSVNDTIQHMDYDIFEIPEMSTMQHSTSENTENNSQTDQLRKSTRTKKIPT